MSDEEARAGRDPSDEDFAEAWEHGDELDVGADTSRFEAFKNDDTAELLRRQIHDDDAHDDPPDAHAQPDPSGGLNTAVIVGVLLAVFAVVVVLSLLN